MPIYHVHIPQDRTTDCMFLASLVETYCTKDHHLRISLQMLPYNILIVDTTDVYTFEGPGFQSAIQNEVDICLGSENDEGIVWLKYNHIPLGSINNVVRSDIYSDQLARYDRGEFHHWNHLDDRDIARSINMLRRRFNSRSTFEDVAEFGLPKDETIVIKYLDKAMDKSYVTH